MTERLHIAPCSHFMAKQAVGRWHYSRRMPSVTYPFAATESGRFVGVVLFGIAPATTSIGAQFGLVHDELRPKVTELVRVALDRHSATVSRIVAISVKQLTKAVPSLRLIVTFADPAQGHHGGIYQAGNWIYLGTTSPDRKYRIHGKVVQPKTVYCTYGEGGQSVSWLRANVDPAAESLPTPPKHKYVLPLDAEMRAIVAPLAKPYPKRAESIVSDVAANHAEEGGANPTSALDLFGEVA